MLDGFLYPPFKKTPPLTKGAQIMNNVNDKVLSILDDDYQNWVEEVNTRYKQSQIRASVHVNSELLHFYWSLGKDIVKMKSESRWGDKFYEILSKDLRVRFKDSKGFSSTNLNNMRRFYELFPLEEISQQLVDQIVMVPWSHILALLSRVNKDQKKAIFYIQKTIENGWSRSMLEINIDSNLYERQCKTK